MLPSPGTPLILGRPWLELHVPHVAYGTGRLWHLPRSRRGVSPVHHRGWTDSARPTVLRSRLEWSQPTNRKQLQSFLGFTNFYRCFFRDYSKVAASLTALTSSLRPFAWTPSVVFSQRPGCPPDNILSVGNILCFQLGYFYSFSNCSLNTASQRFKVCLSEFLHRFENMSMVATKLIITNLLSVRFCIFWLYRQLAALLAAAPSAQPVQVTTASVPSPALGPVAQPFREPTLASPKPCCGAFPDFRGFMLQCNFVFVQHVFHGCSQGSLHCHPYHR